MCFSKVFHNSFWTFLDIKNVHFACTSLFEVAFFFALTEKSEMNLF